MIAFDQYEFPLALHRWSTLDNGSMGNEKKGLYVEPEKILSLRPSCPDGGIGRHAGLKILWPVLAVRVQVPLRALLHLSPCHVHDSPSIPLTPLGIRRAVMWADIHSIFWRQPLGE